MEAGSGIKAPEREMSGEHQHGSIQDVGLEERNVTEALGKVDHEINRALLEFKMFNVTLIGLALCILAVTGLYTAVSCFRRQRMSKRAHVYESAVGGRGAKPKVSVDVRAVTRLASFRSPLSLFRKQDACRDNSRIYYIYSNPLPVGVEEENVNPLAFEESCALSGLEEDLHHLVHIKELMTIEDYAKDPDSGIILDPPNFYMQL